MKSAVIGFALMFLAMFAVATSCSITHRSDGFACTKTAECNDGRQCIDGFCVTSGGNQIDAANGDAPHGDANSACPSPCTSCNTGSHTCIIDCSANPSTCSSHVTCPVGWTCDLRCNTDNACRSGVTCAGTTACNVTCSGKQACEQVACGASKCNVQCTGQASCKSIACGNSCACDVSCTGINACTGGGITCTGDVCKFGLGCSSLSQACHSC
jgi:hypothetical protein